MKCTIGNIRQGVNLRPSETPIDELTGIIWQAHHREVKEPLGLVWGFIEAQPEFNYPGITGIFYSDALKVKDWGAISPFTLRGQVTIPIRVRRGLGVKPGDKVTFTIEGDEVRLAPPSFTLESAYGSGKPSPRPEDFEDLSGCQGGQG